MASGYLSPDSAEDRRKRARYRRAQATSSDSSDAGDFDISNVRLRVAAPPPHPLPMGARWDAQCNLISEALGRGFLETETKKILSAEEVDNVISVDLVSRVHPDIDEDQPTLLIVAPWVDGSATL